MDYLIGLLELLTRYRNAMLKSSKPAGILFIPEELMDNYKADSFVSATVPIVLSGDIDPSSTAIYRFDYTDKITEIEEQMKTTEHRIAVLSLS